MIRGLVQYRNTEPVDQENGFLKKINENIMFHYQMRKKVLFHFRVQNKFDNVLIPSRDSPGA